MQKSDQLTQSVGLQQLGHMSVILLHGGNDPYRNHVAQRMLCQLIQKPLSGHMVAAFHHLLITIVVM